MSHSLDAFPIYTISGPKNYTKKGVKRGNIPDGNEPPLQCEPHCPTLSHTGVTCAPVTPQLSTSCSGHHLIELGEGVWSSLPGAVVLCVRAQANQLQSPWPSDQMQTDNVWAINEVATKCLWSWSWLCLEMVWELRIKPHINLLSLFDETDLSSGHCPTLSVTKGQMPLRS